ncbi:MAG: branched-chain amino acid ABC transporter permease [Bdellovibrionales bacterium]|jgi:branched-chain amino acid transport system permease protein|nr:branched-chain amino acid ABC transporter permease [Bdellovibrionales bacterium]MBT3524752.1 branched-chain amino acid ABC transporter permease [Bdellovibrionales bacterium]MBT7669430.1 branched-chain amino acid ABC transporter permease [Bdellovibrionales bacterium]MBT7767657.1 branched-chain amino acid ABC transporter permease [Bdellovibrionales bacterium]
MKKIIPLIIVLFFIILPLIVSNAYYLHLLILVMLWIIIGTGWNVIAGYTGQVSFGDAAFFGTGAYAAGLLTHHFAISAWWGMGLGGFMAMLIALPFGWICFRLRGAYFALASLALNEILRQIAVVAVPITDGMAGILIMPTFVSKIPYYYIALGLAISSTLLVKYVMSSRWGYYFLSIREDQDAAESLGIDTHFYKMISLNIAAFLTGVAGALFMNYMGFIDPHVVFSLHDISIMAILVGIVGGVGTLYGPIVGAVVMVAVQEIFRTGCFGLLKFIADSTGSETMKIVTEYVAKAHVLGFGALVIVVILFLPNGIVGDWHKITGRLTAGSKKGV